LSCDKYDKLLNLFLDGRLNQSEEKELKEHLSRCKRCQEQLSLLQSIEAKARAIKAKEPPQEYWDTFSSRVRERIRTQEEKSPAFSWKKALENFFSFSPLKIKVAAGVISVVLVFVIGKLYVDYRGEEIIPSKKVAKVQEPPRVEIAEIELEEESSPAEKSEERKPVLDKQEVAKEDVADLHREIVPSKKGVEEKVVPQRGKEAPSPMVAEKEAAPVPAAPAVQIPAPEKGKAEEQAVVMESKTAGAGVDREAEKKRAKIVSGEELSSIAARDSLKQSRLNDVAATPVGFVDRQAPTGIAVYTLQGESVAQIGEADTVTQADNLKRVVRIWKTFIDENPADSLSQEGYLQIATAYHLLARASQDTSVISEGSHLIEQYLKQVRDPAIKEGLNDKLKKIQALREK
jgi:hypothetical protein